MAAVDRIKAGTTGAGRRGEARTLVEFAYESLRQDILRGALTPGMKLRVEMLKDQYQVGSSTLREALTLLVGEHLVTSEGQRGFRVAPISLADLRDITENRKLLETKAMRDSLRLGDDTWEAGVVAAFHRLSKVEEHVHEDPIAMSHDWEERNRAFHEALVAACPSRWLLHFHDILYQQSERYRRLALTGHALQRDVHAEHKALMEASLARDADLACRLTEEHIDRTVEALTRMLTANGELRDGDG